MNIIYRDLKVKFLLKKSIIEDSPGAYIFLMTFFIHTQPENLLLDEKGNIKIADFGFAKKVENRTFTLCGMLF
jgi:serine/threonine protein kinase